MGRRKLLKSHERRAVFGLPTDDDSLIRHYTLSPKPVEFVDHTLREARELSAQALAGTVAGFRPSIRRGSQGSDAIDQQAAASSRLGAKWAGVVSVEAAIAASFETFTRR